MFHGNSTLSAFQLARGYSPSILGIPSEKVSNDLLDAHKQTTASRVIQRLLNSRDNRVISRNSLNPGDDIWVYFNTSKQNERPRWIRATVIDAAPHIVKCRRSTRGPPMTVAYEHIRIAPKGRLARELQEGVLEDVLSEIEPEHTADDSEAHIERRDIMDEIFGSDEEEGQIEGANENMQPIRSYLGAANNEDPVLDIGMDKPIGPEEPCTLKSEEPKVLKELYRATGGKQVTRKHLESAPNWIVDKAVKIELEENWNDAYDEVDENDIPANANVIGSHFVYKVKDEGSDSWRMKARLCPHGNRDVERNSLRKD